MGRLEAESRKRTRIATLQKAVLATVAIAEMLSIAVVAPNVIGALGKMGIIKKPRRDSINRARDRLIEHGLLEYKSGFLRLTQRGETELRKVQSSEYQLKKPKRWDGKWRILIFDIKEQRRTLRDRLRQTLVATGFNRLQDSVWVYPYDCEDFVTLLKADFKIGRDLLYLIVDKVEGDNQLRKHFGL